MPTTTSDSVLEGLRSSRSDLQLEIQGLIEERDRLYGEFQARLSDHNRPTEDEVVRFNARRDHEEKAVRPTAEEVAQFEARLNTGPTKDEITQFDSSHVERRTAIRRKMDHLAEVNERIEEQLQLDHSRSVAERASAGVEFSRLERQREPVTYREDNQNQISYFLDLAAIQNMEVRSRDTRLHGYEERLQRHAKEMADILPERWARRKSEADDRVEAAENEYRSRMGLRKSGLEISPFVRQTHAAATAPEETRGDGSPMEMRAPSRIVGQGGYAIPPLWLIDEYIPALRPGRVAASLCRQMPLPQGTDSINIPRLLTPTLTGVQTADAAPVVSRDFSDTFQQANVKTIAGQEDVPIQLVEQSPGQILDRVLMTDLIADYNKQVDVQVLTGTGVGAPLSGGQVVGVYPASNWGSTTISGTALGAGSAGTAGWISPQAEYFQSLGALASKTAYARFNLRDFTYLTHPRRWFWGVTGLDGFGRFLGSDDGFGPTNSSAIEMADMPFEGLAGRVPWGPRVYIDANVPTTDSGAGSVGGGTCDFSMGAIWDDLWLFEGDLRTRVLTEVLSGTLELRFQVFAYVAFLQRYGVSVALNFNTQYTQPFTASGSSTGTAY